MIKQMSEDGQDIKKMPNIFIFKITHEPLSDKITHQTRFPGKSS